MGLCALAPSWCLPQACRLGSPVPPALPLHLTGISQGSTLAQPLLGAFHALSIPPVRRAPLGAEWMDGGCYHEEVRQRVEEVCSTAPFLGVPRPHKITLLLSSPHPSWTSPGPVRSLFSLPLCTLLDVPRPGKITLLLSSLPLHKHTLQLPLQNVGGVNFSCEVLKGLPERGCWRRRKRRRRETPEKEGEGGRRRSGAPQRTGGGGIWMTGILQNQHA